MVLYYLRERISGKNLEVKRLIITNIYEWFIFDSLVFERLFAQNKKLVQQFQDFEEKRLASTNTDFFYKQIAEPFIAAVENEVEFTYFNLKDYLKPLRNTDLSDDKALIALFKVLSPEHLLKLPFANDSNSLDRRFYGELLHIIGLTEYKDGGKKLIDRHKAGERNSGSILEDTIIQLDSLDKIGRLSQPLQFGATHADRLFNVALELSITWINRILFLKLLEGQLISYHKGDRSYAFLHSEKLREYDDLNSLFFQVLAKRNSDRNTDVTAAFAKVPYLNSSLFEPTELEHQTIFISNLKDDKTIPLHRQTVLKDEQGKTRTGSMRTLEYLFRFLDAYDFSSEGAEDIQEDNKTLINASVLGLIFEKINGYKDGSFFTPGFITMYMCRETIRRAVVQKFNETKGWNCANLDELYDKIEDRAEANRIVNSVRICDPAVGSGHFLVSALNEMIALKSDLRILQDREGRRLKEYSVEVVNDELIVTEEDGGFFEYTPTSVESQRVQQTLFHEKQTIIENCLFGVDINPNSVKICRLRLWIELLKNAYYKNADELETLPNIDINIKCGNSLVSRFALDADLKKALKSLKYDISTYRNYVREYRQATNKDVKRGLNDLINQIKADFRTEIGRNDPMRKRLDKLASELYHRFTGNFLFEPETPYGGKPGDLDKKRAAEKEKLEKEIEKITAEMEAVKANRMYENAFEWRFEFPEVLNDEGDFVGFDVVMGNPPYISLEKTKGLSEELEKIGFKTYSKRGDIYCIFVEQGFRILKKNGIFSYIMPNKWMQANYGKELREYLLSYNLLSLVDFGDIQIFDEATTYPCVLTAIKSNHGTKIKVSNVKELVSTNFSKYIDLIAEDFSFDSFSDEIWVTSSNNDIKLLNKVHSVSVTLEKFVKGQVNYGIKFGLTEAFLIDIDTKNKIEAEEPKSADMIGPVLRGRDLMPYCVRHNSNAQFIILAHYGSNVEIINKYPAIYKHLSQYETKLKDRGQCKGSKMTENKPYEGQHHWLELDNNPSLEYLNLYKEPKIMYQSFQVKPCFIYDENGLYCNNSMWFIPTRDKVLLGILNSKMGWWLISKYCTAIQNGYQLIWKYFGQIPIATGNDEIRKQIETLVNQILAQKQNDPSADTTALEREIDGLVYGLYGLTAEEIQIIIS